MGKGAPPHNRKVDMAHEAQKVANVTIGYLAYLVIEKLPGRCVGPGEFWGVDWDKEKRDTFRNALVESARVFEKLGIVSKDRAMRNLLYHEYKDENGEDRQKWLVHIPNPPKMQPKFANNEIVTSSIGNGGLIGKCGETGGAARGGVGGGERADTGFRSRAKAVSFRMREN
ncbi:hypothetical protein CJF32_00005196 [Rutstroemia sp. NJR-2017a WRK4]|nr:hypothetical protein CJF32_00005196 [Rutstroemia sp. NJR-2017a WRK4]